jgi:hypothetical protein
MESTRESASESDIEALYEYLMTQANYFTQADIPRSSTEPVGNARANRKSVYPFKLTIIGDLEYFIPWIENGAHVASIGLQQAVTYKNKRYYTASINQDGTYNLIEGGPENIRIIAQSNIPYKDLILPDSHFIPGSQSIDDLNFYLKRLKLSAQNASNILLKLHNNPDVLYEHYKMQKRNRLTQQIVKEWLSDQANQIFDKIKKIYSAERNLRNIDADNTISQVKKILDNFVSSVLQLIIPREVDEYRKMERQEAVVREERKMERKRLAAVVQEEMKEEEKRRDKSNISRPPNRERSRSPPIRRGGKSMKPKQHRNSKTQKKRQRKNQKK